MPMKRRTILASSIAGLAGLGGPARAQFRVEISWVGATQLPIAIPRFRDEDKAPQPIAQIIRADSDAKASKIYADAFNKDPKFYDFYRAMQSYDTTFGEGKGKSSIILSPDNEYLRQFRGER